MKLNHPLLTCLYGNCLCPEGGKSNSKDATRGGSTPIYGLYRCVPRNRVSFLRFSVLK